MANSAHASWNAIRIVYGNGYENEPMVDKKKLVFFIGVNP
jgi:hypothetical protein